MGLMAMVNEASLNCAVGVEGARKGVAVGGLMMWWNDSGFKMELGLRYSRESWSKLPFIESREIRTSQLQSIIMPWSARSHPLVPHSSHSDWVPYKYANNCLLCGVSLSSPDHLRKKCPASCAKTNWTYIRETFSTASIYMRTT